jgi:peroxiredoxin
LTTVALDIRGILRGVSSDLETFVTRALTLLGALLLVGVVVGVTVLVAARLSARSAAVAPAPAAAVSAGAGSPRRDADPPRAVAAEAGRLTLEAAMRELDLIKPPRLRPAEDFSLPTPDGRTFRLSDQRGKVVFINFWATWCPPCRDEMPSLERLYAQRKDGPFALVAISLDANPVVVAPYLKQSRLTFPVALDPKMDLANAYGVRALPASFVLDPRGMLVAMALGPRHWDGPVALAVVDGLAR